MAIEEVAPQILQELGARPRLGPWLRSHGLDRPWIEAAVRRTWAYWKEHPEEWGKCWKYSNYHVEQVSISDHFRFDYECKGLLNMHLTKQELKRSIMMGCDASAQLYVDQVFEYRRRWHKDSGLPLVPIRSEQRKAHFQWLVFARVLGLTASQIRKRYAKEVTSDEAINCRVRELARLVGLPARARGGRRRNTT
jgi:hypothetical protein